ncbi:PREDICTED: vicilin-like seed storage protein At2g28490 [Camelina sativa]|uniref:Vicilin-like seed storage protein At2g28490 n=1 Tax=Camelina sativa TaxID=90675 RepID=A0AA51NHK7_CAMSA|nr:PREDICTED: vicilin-like seed storage protein At2g28490 [Camelina sativa]UNP61737.1 vicilin Vic2-1-G3 [Camelina sativa]WMQ52474.1 Vicillin [Camelina sativa]
MEKNKRTFAFLLLLVLIHGVMVMRSNGYEGEEGWGGEGGGDWGGEGGGGGDWGGEGEGGGGGGEWGGEGGRGGGGGGGGRRGWFMMRESRQVIKSEGGEMRVVISPRGRIIEKPMHIGFLTMEPKTLFVPQYLDSSLLIFIRQGEATLGVICKDEFGERRLKAGDIYWIPAGSVFYLHNTGRGQRLHVICSIDPTQSLGFETFQPFYIGGGPSSVLAGFDPDTLTSALNVSRPELQRMMRSQFRGPIVHVMEGPEGPQPTTTWTQFLGLREEEKRSHLKKLLEMKQGSPQDQQYSSGWSWRTIIRSFMDLIEEKNKGSGSSECHDSYNIYDQKPSFKNDYGWSTALDYEDYEPLKHSGIGVFLVNLTAGSMMAPHMNPTATEYGIVLAGSGEIQVVFPNGTSAMNTRVSVGDVFWIPRYFAFCQIASRTAPFEFVGFTTSAHKNRPQFLVGSKSLLTTLNVTSLSMAFGVDEGTMRGFIEPQREAVILPTASAAPPHVG